MSQSSLKVSYMEEWGEDYIYFSVWCNGCCLGTTRNEETAKRMTAAYKEFLKKNPEIPPGIISSDLVRKLLKRIETLEHRDPEEKHEHTPEGKP